MEKLSLKEIKSLLALAEKHNLTTLSVNGLTLNRNSSYLMGATSPKPPFTLDGFDDLPTTIEELDAPLKQLIKPYMEA